MTPIYWSYWTPCWCFFVCIETCKGYCAGFAVWSSLSSSADAAGGTADSRGCVWSEVPCFLSPGCSTAPLLYPPDYCQEHQRVVWECDIFSYIYVVGHHHVLYFYTIFTAHLLPLSSLRLCLVLSFSSRADGFFLLHFSSLLLGPPSDRGSVFSWSDGSLCRGYAIKHRFPSSSSSKLTDTTPTARRKEKKTGRSTVSTVRSFHLYLLLHLPYSFKSHLITQTNLKPFSNVKYMSSIEIRQEQCSELNCCK